MTEIDINLVWNQVLPLLEKSLNRPIYEALISSTKPVAYKAGRFEAAVPNQLVKDWLSKYCVTLLEQELRAFLPDITLVNFIVGPEDLFSTPLFEPSAPVTQNPPQPQQVNLCLNFRYTFDNFVVGHGNRFAHAAALAVAESPASAYNPFFLYGGVGLGKTHLMQAIGHHVAARNPRAKILYTSSEMFTNDLINSIRDDKTVQFRNKYRNIDVLMVDDIQFIAGKERTQEEFFHTFNALYEAQKQIVLSSDRPPKEMLTLEERLRSRFEWGLTADVQEPDFETRVAILKKKAEISGIAVSDEVLALIASRIISNIRKLEGALIRVVAFASLTGREIDLALVDGVLKDIATPEKDALNISIDLIKKITAEHFGLRVEDLSAKIRTEKIAGARQMAMYLARELTRASLPKIGNAFGGRDHTTVMHACDKIKSRAKNNPVVADGLKAITATIKKYTPRTV
ncbi:MAG: chromosomal replication initiator protein DnaA [Candidatus Margulisbacteria bacterium]|nr:chromosomal replication initiator protein DnaA [Candidatus Margulisiibacteriota bacterium]